MAANARRRARLAELEAENADLRAEVERLKAPKPAKVTPTKLDKS